MLALVLYYFPTYIDIHYPS